MPQQMATPPMLWNPSDQVNWKKRLLDFLSFSIFLGRDEAGDCGPQPIFQLFGHQRGKDTRDTLGGPGSPSNKLGRAGAVFFVCFVEHLIY